MRAGIAPVRAVTRVVKSVQQHRGLSAAALAGVDAAARATRQRDVDEAFKTLEQQAGDAAPQVRRVQAE